MAGPMENERALEIILELMAETEAAIEEAKTERRQASQHVAQITERRDAILAARTSDETTRRNALTAALAADTINDADRDALVMALRTNTKDELDRHNDLLNEAAAFQSRKNEVHVALVERRRVLRRVLKFLTQRLN